MTKNDIQEFIDDVINPGLAMHDGYVLVENFDENTNILKVQMGGGCQGCASSVTTLKLMIGNTLREEFPLLVTSTAFSNLLRAFPQLSSPRQIIDERLIE